ncbi:MULTISPECIES: hypothetical protein [Kitasatospora]|nr:hypothetical protein [Kitasatospora sp. GP30]MDH6139356.1 hypothetical protein [Kitasatospora sp. GP30]
MPVVTTMGRGFSAPAHVAYMASHAPVEVLLHGGIESWYVI